MYLVQNFGNMGGDAMDDDFEDSDDEGKLITTSYLLS